MTTSQKYRWPPGTGILKMLRERMMFMPIKRAVMVSQIREPLRME